MPFRSGRPFLQLPGPTNVPGRVLRAMSRPTIDHRGPEFSDLTREILERIGVVFGTDADVFIFPASASGAWEAALVNTLSPGDTVLAVDQGFFSSGWQQVATRLGLDVEVMPADWRVAVDPDALEARLAADASGLYKAILLVHNETSTGVTSDVAAIGEAIRRTGHSALFMVDAVSSLGSVAVRHDAWHVDVTVAGSQKGLMLPPGLGFNAVSGRALAASRSARLSRSYWDWGQMRAFNEDGFFPYTPATNMLFGLRESLSMLAEEGLSAVFMRHQRLAEATRRAVEGWGLEIFAMQSENRSDTVTTVLVPEEVNADLVRREVLERYDLSLGTGLGKLKGRVFRIGHLGDLNELMLAGTLCGIELGLRSLGVCFEEKGVSAALAYLAGQKERVTA